MIAHPLTRFTYETFGQQFGDLLLAGYGEKPGGGRRMLHLTESEAGARADWVIELIGNHLPCGDEPLVLAALLKLLLSRPIISPHLEFKIIELLPELGWQDDPDIRRHVEEAIVGYAGQHYDKRADARAGRRASETAEGGCYHLLTGYIRGVISDTGGALVRTPDIACFDGGFITGLKEGRVTFAGIDFGSVRMAGVRA
jgi:hypothetical protein